MFVAPVHGAVQLGSEVLAGTDFKILQGKRVGLITNPSGINGKRQSTIDLFRRAKEVRLVALFAPEHGLDATIPAGKEFKDATDPRTGLPVFSLYGPGPTRKPTAKMLREIDVLVYDIQDTGCRSYTYISTMGLAMEACGEANVDFVVLDRPNPLGGERIEGPMVEDRFRTLVSRWDTPYVYGMTSGELAQMINGERWITRSCRLTIVRMSGWKRSMLWRDTGLPWVPTSPNVRHGNAPLYQVATGILGEIGGVNIGMGTEHPFECIAAPWLDGSKFCAWFNQQDLPGVRFELTQFRSPRGIFRGKTVSGARIVFANPRAAPLTAINFYALQAVKDLAGRDLFAEAVKANKDFAMFDKVNGTDAVRKALQAGKPAREIVASWRPGEDQFRRRRQKYLLY